MGRIYDLACGTARIEVQGEQPETVLNFCIENGIEFNREEETFVQNADVLREFFTAEKFHNYFNKEKRAFGFVCHLTECPEIQFNAELENVNGFTYLEVENTTGAAEPDAVRGMLENLFVVLGLNPQDKDSRSWMKILRGEC